MKQKLKCKRNLIKIPLNQLNLLRKIKVICVSMIIKPKLWIELRVREKGKMHEELTKSWFRRQ